MLMFFKALFASCTFLLIGGSLNAQISVDNSLTPAQMVDALTGPGVSVSNITYTGGVGQSGSFDGSLSNIGLLNGIVLSSGLVDNIVPPNIPSTNVGGAGDPDLVTVAQSVTSNPEAGLINSTFDVAILEFDFIPSGDSVSFGFVFASEEYLAWVNTQYNDAFGFFISGPGFAGPYAAPGAFPLGAENLAFVPGTTDPITISTINPGLNPSYYIDNPAGATHSFNGFTVPMSIEFVVVCGQTYHFKFAVADCQDGILDTGVFLEGSSFISNAVEVVVATVTGDTSVFEGCTWADFIFSRPISDTTDTLIINYAVSGTATSGVDYAALTNPVIFLPGEDTVIVTLIPNADGIPEPGESVIITAFTVNACGDTVLTSGTVWIFDEPDIQINELDTTIMCPTDSVLAYAFASGGFGPYTYVWTGYPSVTSQEYLPGLIPGPIDYYVEAMDQCGNIGIDTITITLNQTLAIDSLVSTPSSTCSPTGSVTVYSSGETTIISPTSYHWDDSLNYANPGAGTFSNTAVWAGLPSGWYYVTVTDDVCSVSDSIFVSEAASGTVGAFAHDTTVYCILDSMLVFADPIGGSSPYSYSWSTTGDTTLINSTTVPINANGSIDYYITIIDACGAVGVDTLTVTVNQTLALDSLTTFWSSQCGSTGIVGAFPTGVTSVLSPTSFLWNDYDNHINPGSGSSWPDTIWSGIPSGWYYVTVTDDVCSVNDSIWVTEVPLPISSFIASPLSGCSPVTAVFTNTSQSSADFEWSFGGNIVNVTNQDPIAQTFTSTSIVTLIAYDATGCADTSSTTITVITCGCMDPIATNYNPAAVQDDGSCYFPEPTVIAPNIFTPNGDGNNDVFFLEVTNAINVDIIILNRWGNQMFNQSGLDLSWDGTVGGELAEDGTYFVKYTVTGVPGTTSVSGHGFVQLVSNE